MIGDPMQLSPIVRSNDAKAQNFDVSLFEQCLDKLSYDRPRRNNSQKQKQKQPKQKNSCRKPPVITRSGTRTGQGQLTTISETRQPDDDINPPVCESLFYYQLLNVQYRMHPKIAAFPSQFFYQSRLLTDSNIESKSILFLSKLEWNNFHPLCFVNVSNSQSIPIKKSLKNETESEIVCRIAELLLKKKIIKTGKKIGIIAPYREQVKCLKELISRFGDNMKKIDVSTINKFQGREKHIIILSLTKATGENGGYNGYSGRGGGGRRFGGYLNSNDFFQNIQRCNVALTRAKYLLIVVGSQRSICNAKNWGRWLDYVLRNGLCCQAQQLLQKLEKQSVFD